MLLKRRHLEYKVTLPDHNYVKAPNHKLIPDVYHGTANNIPTMQTGNTNNVGILDQLMLQSCSPIFEHLKDSQTQASLSYHKCIITCDGGSEEKPRYVKMIDCAA